MGRGLIIALGLSLALNVFAVGFISGRVIGEDGPHKPPHGDHGGGHSYRMLHIADALPDARREEFRGAFKEKLPAMREHFKEMRDVRRELNDLLAAADWDRAAVEAKMAEIKAIQDRQQAAFEDAFLDAYETLTPEERAQLKAALDERRADRRERWKKRRLERRGDGPGDMGPPPAPEE